MAVPLIMSALCVAVLIVAPICSEHRVAGMPPGRVSDAKGQMETVIDTKTSEDAGVSPLDLRSAMGTFLTGVIHPCQKGAHGRTQIKLSLIHI